ncbi:MAG TPA: regulatory iron-sulfur-containing complex subunit RicT [bacterium]|nr:regulatory iron-sulfur-containing complex subunit RicT [bacterium]
MDVMDVRVREYRAIARFKSDSMVLPTGAHCLVEVEGDRELATVLRPRYEWTEDLPPELGVFFVRPAEDADLATFYQNREKEREAFVLALQKVKDRELPMILVAVEQTLDGKKVRFYFTADGRIDFRDLVRDLAHVFRTRIEMRQIGVRDRSRKVGGFGPCGEQLCCNRFISTFDPITIKMAKEQNLALNPSKLSGVCGRLKCCLAYEVDTYRVCRKNFPNPNQEVTTPIGSGVVIDQNVIKGTVTTRYEGGQAPREWPIEDINFQQ